MSTVILKYSYDDTEPGVEDPNYLELDCIYDDRGVEPIQEETILADKSIYPERDGTREILKIYLNPDQVDDNLSFFKAMLGARNIWALTPDGLYNDDGDAIPSSIEDREYTLKFLDMLDSPFTFKRCALVSSTGGGDEDMIPNGIATLDANGTVTVESSDVTVAEKIFLHRTSGESNMSIKVSAVEEGVSFTITSSGGPDDAGQQIGWRIYP